MKTAGLHTPFVGQSHEADNVVTATEGTTVGMQQASARNAREEGADR